jgi:uncharacterized phage protein gp47/JayE
MPRFIPKRYEQILPQMIARVITRTGMSDVSDSSIVKHILAAAARADDEQYYQMSLILELFSIDTAVGEDLDERAAEIQPALISRIQAQKATGTVVFSRNTASGLTVTIPIGTKIKTSDGIVFKTTSTGTITPGSPEQIGGHGAGRDSNLVAIVAEVAGTSGNVAANTIIKFVSKPGGVDQVTNLTSLINGLDKETDDSFRQRIKDYVASLARSTPQALESGVVGQQDPDSGAIILYAKVVEDIVNLGNVTLYIDDGTGAAESVATTPQALAATYTWNGTTTVTCGDTSEITEDDFIRLDSDGTWFPVVSIVADVSVTIGNPDAVAIPSGATQSSKGTDLLTLGLAGPPPNSAVGGETTLFTDIAPIKDTDPFVVTSSTRGLLIRDTDYILNPASGQIDFTPALSTGERVLADYTYYEGLIALAQKIVDGDPDDPLNYPGLRAAGVYVRVQTPQVLLQTVDVVVTVAEGYDQDEVKSEVRQAIKDYINTLNISGDVIRNRLITKMMLVPGVVNVLLDAPSADVPILDDQLARTQDVNISVG